MKFKYYFINRYRQWDKSLLVQYIPPVVTTAVTKLFIPTNQIPYELLWGLLLDGDYSIKSGV